MNALHNITISRQSREMDASPYPGGFCWFAPRNAPGRIQFADKVSAWIRHTGWFCDRYQDEKARGIVCALSHGRFLAGVYWSGRGCYEVSTKMYGNAEDAAYAANEQARIEAGEEYEHNEAWQEGERLRGLIEEKRKDVFELFEARHHPRVRRDIVETIAHIRGLERELSDLVKRHGLSF